MIYGMARRSRLLLRGCPLFLCVLIGLTDYALAGRRLGTEINISAATCPDCFTGWPGVVYNNVQNEFLVVWENAKLGGMQEIYARRLSRTGVALDWITVAAGPLKRNDPAVAFNALNSEYLVVWRYDTLNDGSHFEIWGRRIAWNGTYIGPEFQILAWPNRNYWLPRVVWNSNQNEYLVVASVYDTQNNRWNDVARRRVLADGTMPFPGGSIFQDPNLQPHQADAVYNMAADEYLVVWRQKYTDTDWDIWGVRLRGDSATVISPPGNFYVTQTAEDQENPAVTTNSLNRYLVVWEQATTNRDILGQELDNFGQKIGSELFLAASANFEYLPAAKINGTSDEWIVAWGEMKMDGVEVWAAFWVGSNPVVLLPFRITTYSMISPYGHKALAFGNAGVLFVYNKFENDVYQIYGRFLWPDSIYLPLLLR
jgi:hypothetical protein